MSIRYYEITWTWNKQRHFFIRTKQKLVIFKWIFLTFKTLQNFRMKSRKRYYANPNNNFTSWRLFIVEFQKKKNYNENNDPLLSLFPFCQCFFRIFNITRIQIKNNLFNASIRQTRNPPPTLMIGTRFSIEKLSTDNEKTKRKKKTALAVRLNQYSPRYTQMNGKSSMIILLCCTVLKFSYYKTVICDSPDHSSWLDTPHAIEIMYR